MYLITVLRERFRKGLLVLKVTAIASLILLESDGKCSLAGLRFN